MHELTIGVVLAGQALWEEAQKSLQELPVRIVLEMPGVEDRLEFLQRLGRARPDVLLLDVAHLGDDLQEIFESVLAMESPARLVAVSATAEPHLILKSMRAGAREFLYPPFGNSLREALERIAAELDQRESAGRPAGRTFGFLSAKGGCGATTLVCHAASEIKRMTRRDTLLADLDMESSLVRTLMRPASRYSVLDAVANLARLDRSYWGGLVSNGTGQPEILAGPSEPVTRDLPTPSGVRQMLRFARNHYEFLLLDLGRGLTPIIVGALDEVDELVLVTTMEVPALQQAKALTQALIGRGFARSRIRLVVNRVPRRPEVTIQELENAMGIPVFAQVPNDYQVLYEAYADGRLVDPETMLGRQIRKFCIQLTGWQPEEKRKRFTLFG